MSQSFITENRRQRAAQLVAEGEYPDGEIAAAVGVCPSTLWRWRQDPEFAARVHEIQSCLADLSRRYLLARKRVRIGRLSDRHARLERVLDARAADPDLQKAPGGDTGALVRRQRMIGHGQSAVMVEEFDVDVATFKELREIEKQIAIELGQWTEKKEIAGGDGGPLILQVIEEVVDGRGPEEAAS